MRVEPILYYILRTRSGVRENVADKKVLADTDYNVGDVAGMGADLFESYVGSIIAAATLRRFTRMTTPRSTISAKP